MLRRVSVFPGTWRIRALATVSGNGFGVPQTYIEKIVQKYAVDLPPGKIVRAGDYVMIKPEHVMSHDNTGPIISKFQALGATKIERPTQPVFTLDHDVQNKSEKNLSKYAKIEAFARRHGIDFYPAGRGIGHQVLIEEGYAFPHCLTVASDSHSNMYGGVGCLGTPIVRTDGAALWATGKTWWQIPRMVKVELKGRLRDGVTGKDVIVALCGAFNQDEVLNAAIEFVGDGIPCLSVDDRLAIANMTTEWGALAGVFPVDAKLLEWYRDVLDRLEKRTFSIPSSKSIPPPPPHPRLNRKRLQILEDSPIMADSTAFYSAHLTLDLASLSPHVSGPNSVKKATPLSELESARIPIQKAYLVSCTNSRASDLSSAAAVLNKKYIASGVELYVAAASSEVQAESERRGDWATLIAAGAKVLPPGCGPCIGLGTGLLEEGETGISATNRNYKGRMGHPKAQAYLASPAVVAASAVNGFISGPSSLSSSSQAQPLKISHIKNHRSAGARAETSQEALISGFPSAFSGQLLFAPQDNLNTDAIYPGKYTYQDDITLDEQAKVVMENYDPSFATTVADLKTRQQETRLRSDQEQRGLILVSGYNFGTGSSREQAATALKAAGIPLIIAGSFGDIFKRNSINNGLICLECPELVDDLTGLYGMEGSRGRGGVDGRPTAVPQWALTVSMIDGSISAQTPFGIRKYQTTPVGASVQELWKCGGLEGYVGRAIHGDPAQP